MTCFPKSSLTWNFTLDFKQLVFCASPFLLQTGPLIFEWNVKLTYHGATEGVIFLIGSWCTDSSPSHLLVKLPTFFEWPSLDKPLGSAVIPVAPFPTTLSPSTPVFMNMLGYSTMWTAGCFSDDLLRRSLLVEGVNDFWTTVRASSFPWLWSLLNHTETIWRLRKPLKVF